MIIYLTLSIRVYIIGKHRSCLDDTLSKTSSVSGELIHDFICTCHLLFATK